MLQSLETRGAVEERAIAFVDDDPIFLDHARTMLAREGFHRVRCLEPDGDMPSRLRALRADCLFLDNDLGRESGLDLGVRVVNEHPDPPSLVMVTGTGSEQVAAKAFRVGFTDYVTKRGLTGGELRRTITRAVSRHGARDGAARGTGEGTREDGRTDPETGLPSPRAMRDWLHAIGGKATRRPIAAYLMEPDGAGALEERIGLVAAHRVRERFLSAVRREAGKLGVLGHWTDDRMLVVSDTMATPERAEKACRALANAVPFELSLEGMRIRGGIAMGAVLRAPGRFDPEPAMRAAEQCLLAAQSGAVPFMLDVDGEAAALGDDGEDSADRRGGHRMRCLRRARIVPPGLNTVVDCVVSNRSRGGMKLRTLSYYVAPERFEVQVVGEGRRRPVVLRWQVGFELGVEFEDEIARQEAEDAAEAGR